MGIVTGNVSIFLLSKHQFVVHAPNRNFNPNSNYWCVLHVGHCNFLYIYIVHFRTSTVLYPWETGQVWYMKVIGSVPSLVSGLALNEYTVVNMTH